MATSLPSHVKPEVDGIRQPEFPFSSPKTTRKSYKPFVLRTPGLLCIFLISLGLIGVLQYAAQTLPLVENRTKTTKLSARGRSQDSSGYDTNTYLSEIEVSGQTALSTARVDQILVARATLIDTTTTTTSYLSQPTFTAAPNSYIAISSTPLGTTAHQAPSSYIAISSIETSTSSPYAYTTTIWSSAFTTAPDAYIATSLIPTPTTAPDAYIATSSIPTATTAPDTYIATSSTAQSAYLVTVGSTSQGAYLTTESSTAQNSYLMAISTLPPQSQETESSTIISAPGTPPPSDYLATLTTSSNAYITPSVYISALTTSNNAYNDTTTHGLLTTTTTTVVTLTTNGSVNAQTSPSTYTTGFGSHPSSLSSAGGDLKSGPVVITWPLWWVFADGYLPLLLAIMVKILWTSVYSNVKLMEPFIQLSKPDGALGSDAFSKQYLSSSLVPVPISALMNRRWTLFWTSIVYLAVGLLSPLASEVLFLDTHYACGSEKCWPPKLSANKTVLRLLQGLLSFVAIMTLSIMVMLYKSTTGLYSNPSSIASIASLLHHPEVLHDFQNMDDTISSKDLKRRLGNRRYQLGTYQRRDGVWRYGIIPAVQGYTPGWTQVSFGASGKLSTPERKRTHHLSATIDIGFGVFMLGVLGVVVAYFIDGSNSGFNRFFNSNTFGPRFFMSSIGCVIAIYWKGIERKVQTLTPFRRLILSPAPAKSSILFRRHSLPPLVMYTSLINGHFFAALVAFTTFLADILTITLAAVPFSPTEIYLELLICAYTSMAILGLMILVILGLMFWKRKLRDMPRKPDTLAGVMSYLCDSQFLADFEGCEMMDAGELDKRIGRSGKRYGFGRFVGVSGRKRWMIEEEGTIS